MVDARGDTVHSSNPTRTFLDGQRHPVVLFTYGVALLAWILLVTRGLPMPGSAMAMRMATPGMPEAMALSNGLFGVGLYLLVWGAMMTAMMYPSSAGSFRAYAETSDAGTGIETAVDVGVVMGTYTLVWVFTGLVSLGFNVVIPVVALAPEQRTVLLAVTLLVVSAYQLSSSKRHHLEHCRTPELDFADETGGIRDAIRSGWRLGLDSIGCCWALMALMVVVGSMNILWMAALTALISVEILAPDGVRLANGLGVLSGVAGIGLLLVGAM